MASPAASSSSSSSSSNPRKFSEKIALQKQRQAEETAAFEEVMMELGTTRLQAQKLRLAHGRGPYCYGGSLPNVNQIGSGAPEFQSPLHSPLDPMQRGGARHHRLVKQVQRDPRRMMSPLRRYMRQIDSSPYSPAYLSPPAEPSWRRAGPWGSFPAEKGHLFRLPSALNRTNSDSALHTSVMNPNPQDPYLAVSQGGAPPNRKAGYLENDMDSKVFLFQVPSIEESFLDEGKQLLKPWDTKKLSSSSARPRSCEVPGIHIFPSPDQPAPLPLLPAPLNTGGSLPDLTNLHFPSPLPTALDPEEPPFPSLSGGSSTGNLASTLTNLGISGGGGGMGLAHGYDSPGLCPPLGSSLSNPCLQSSLLGRPLRPPNATASAASAAAAAAMGPAGLSPSSSSSSSLQGSLSTPSLRSSPSGCSSASSLPSSLSSQSFSSSSLSNPSLSSSLSNPSLPSSSSSLGGGGCGTPLPPLPHPGADPSHGPPSASASSSASSPRRRGAPPPLSPLTLPLSADTRRPPQQQQQHPKQFSPTMSPTLSSITQGVPLDTSRLPADQRLPPYPYGQPAGMLLQPGHKPLHQGPGMASPQQQQQQRQQQQQHQHQMAQHQPPMQQHQPPCSYPMHYQPNSMFQHQFNQPLGDFGLGNFDQYGFMDNVSGGFSFNSSFPDDLGAFSCFAGDGSGGGGGPPSAGHDPHLLNRQNLAHCGRLGPIPNIILTGDSPPGISKEIASALAGMPGFEMSAAGAAAASSSSSSCSPLALEEDLRIEPLTLDAFNMLSDPFAPLTDTAVEDSFRTDRLQ